MMFIKAGFCIKNKLMPVGQYQLSGPIKNFTWSTELCAQWMEEMNLGFWIHVCDTLIFLSSPQLSKYEKLFRNVVVWSTLFLLINNQKVPPPPPTPPLQTHTQSLSPAQKHSLIQTCMYTFTHYTHLTLFSTYILSLLHDGNAVDL